VKGIARPLRLRFDLIYDAVLVVEVVNVREVIGRV
jgi:hypothetical protein